VLAVLPEAVSVRNAVPRSAGGIGDGGGRLTAVVRFSSLGDVVLAGAVTGALGRVVFVTLPRYRDVAARLPGVERVVAWGQDPLPRVARVVDLHASPHSRWACLRMGAPTSRVARHDVARRLRVAFKVGGPPPPVVARYAAAAGTAAAPPPWIAASGPRDALALVPGAAHATKRWPAERYAEIGRRWDGEVLVLGSATEAALCSAVADAVGPRAEAIAEAGFPRTLGALGRVRVAVGGDTGLMHLLAASGARAAVLFGPTTSADGFWDERARALELDLACRPCALHGGPHCPVGDHLCLDGVGVERVWEAIAT
jgi:ADP-heptose:LPS heptosyltransferase